MAYDRLIPKWFQPSVVPAGRPGDPVEGITKVLPAYQCQTCGHHIQKTTPGRTESALRQHFSENLDCRQLCTMKHQKWSRLVRIRAMFKCFVCSEIIPWRQTQAHHIYVKAIYPEKAYDLDNGICVCGPCHQPRIHSTVDSWRKFIPMFKAWLRRASVQAFNHKNQDRIK